MKNKLKKNFCAYFKVLVSNVNILFTSIVEQFPINICKHYCCTYTNLITCKWNGVCFRFQTSLSVFSIFVPKKNTTVTLIKKQSNFNIIFVFKRKNIFDFWIIYYLSWRSRRYFITWQACENLFSKETASTRWRIPGQTRRGHRSPSSCLWPLPIKSAIIKGWTHLKKKRKYLWITSYHYDLKSKPSQIIKYLKYNAAKNPELWLFLK